MKKYLAVFIVTVLCIIGCRKEDIEYQGEVVRGINECTTPKGFPYIVKYQNANGIKDSLITASLPPAYKLPNTKVLFKIRKNISAGEEMVCNGLILPLIQKSIYDIKPQ
ncbi:hypothetical protein ACQ33O_02935 [Ferruginibacter sp. SUN002]|uniref:hypothetical protein n=1 Tax=Ferruginibacter sp. SUN002 TaxID=2937789 RepID=UPI003D36F095